MLGTALVAVVVAAGISLNNASANHDFDPNNAEMMITHSGGDPGPGGGGSILAVPVGGSFNAEINVTNVGPTVDPMPDGMYQGYQWEVAWLDAVLNLGTGGATEQQMSIFNLCAPPPPAPAVVGTLEVYGQGAGCVSSGAPTAFTGLTTTVNLTCAAAGTTYVALVGLDADPIFGTTMLDTGGPTIPTILENQLPNPVPPPDSVAAIVVACVNPVDVSVAKADTADPVAAPGAFQYTITVTNPDSNAQTVDISDTLSNGGTITNADMGCGFTATTVTCVGLNVPANGATVVTVDVSVGTADAGALLSNSATATVTTPNYVDVNPANNTAVETTQVAPTAITISKTSNPPSPITAGDVVTFEYQVCNGVGASEATNIAVTDNVLGAIGVIASLPAGACQTLFSAPTAFPNAGSFNNTGTADPDNGDPDSDVYNLVVNASNPTKGMIDPADANPTGNVWICKSNAGAPTVDCNTLTITELIDMADDVDTCNDDDDGDGAGCASDDGITSDSTDWDGDAQDLDTDGGEIGEGLGAFEFQIKFDHKLLQHPTFDFSNTVLDDTGRVPNCTHDIVTENWVTVGCTSKDPTPGDGDNPEGPSVDGPGNILADVVFQIQPDLFQRIRPTKDNGARADLLDENCEAADILGSPYNAFVEPNGQTESPNGGLADNCTDVTVTIRMLEGDVDLDCDVDVTDDQIIAFRYGATFGVQSYVTFFDLEPNTTPADFDVDIKDLQFVFGRNGSNCVAPIPDQDPQPMVPDP